MGWKHIVASSAATGALLAIFILGVFVLAEIDPGSFAGLCGGFFALSALSAYIANEISKWAGWPEIGLKTLIPVAFFTSIIPLFGPIFGLPNNEPITLVTVVLFGAVGGAFWSIPFAIWNFIRGQKPSEDLLVESPNQTIIQNVTYNLNDSVVTGDMSPIANQLGDSTTPVSVILTESE